MKIRKLLTTCLFALALAAPVAGCDGDSGDENADDNADNADNATTDGAMDIDCNTMCEAYTTKCIQEQGATEFMTNDECVAACGSWDQAGINCRFMQIPDACDQAGNMGSSC